MAWLPEHSKYNQPIASAALDRLQPTPEAGPLSYKRAS